MAPNAAVQRPRAAASSAARVHNEMTHMRRARDGVSRSAATACYALATHSRLPQRVGTPLMKDGEDFDDVVFVKEIHGEWEPPRENTASVQKDARVGQRGLRRSLDRRIQLEKELDT